MAVARRHRVPRLRLPLDETFGQTDFFETFAVERTQRLVVFVGFESAPGQTHLVRMRNLAARTERKQKFQIAAVGRVADDETDDRG